MHVTACVRSALRLTQPTPTEPTWSHEQQSRSPFHPHRTRLGRHPRGGAAHLRSLPQRVLGQARPRGRLSDRIRHRPHGGRLSLRAHSRRVRRLGAAHQCCLRSARDHPRQPVQRGRLPRADVHHGHGAAARQRGAEAEVPAGHRQRGTQAAGVRRHRADHGLRHHPAQDAGRQEGQRPLRRQRPEGVDLPRPAFRPDAAAGAHHARRQSAQALRRALSFPGRSEGSQRQGRRDPQDRRHAQPQHLRGVLRQPGGAGREPDRRSRARASSTSSTA